LGVTFDSNLSFKYHISEKINKANRGRDMPPRPGMRETERDKGTGKVPMRATKIMSRLKNKPYHERLKILNLPTLKFRRQRGDMIETYKILNGIYDKTVTPNILIALESHTRGNSLKIVNHRSHYDLRKYSFCNRVTNIWNKPVGDVVRSLLMIGTTRS